MATQFPITFSLAPIPTGQSLDANQYGQLLVQNLQAFISGQLLVGQIGGAAPTTNIGVWFNNGVWYYWDPGTSAYIPQTLTSSFPTGAVMDYGGSVAPTGFVLCDGGLYLRTGAMAALFGVIGTAFGIGDGSSTFNVPDTRGRAVVGAGSGAGLTVRALGGTTGVEGQVLTTPNLPAHAHPITDKTHAHTVSAFTGTVQGLQAGGATYFLPSVVSTSANFTGITTTNNSGSGTAHNTMQPSVFLNKIIKT